MQQLPRSVRVERAPGLRAARSVRDHAHREDERKEHGEHESVQRVPHIVEVVPPHAPVGDELVQLIYCQPQHPHEEGALYPGHVGRPVVVNEHKGVEQQEEEVGARAQPKLDLRRGEEVAAHLPVGGGQVVRVLHLLKDRSELARPRPLEARERVSLRVLGVPRLLREVLVLARECLLHLDEGKQAERKCVCDDDDCVRLGGGEAVAARTRLAVVRLHDISAPPGVEKGLHVRVSHEGLAVRADCECD
mmetsp:Transcript_10209/g.25696  ORF Transcript_10209/g.25696 Transcript_10209/m.25696 type:complete len:248 (+) Transcript_10209:1123-1866(+)